MLDGLGDLAGKIVTADTLPTRTAIASYLRRHEARYMFAAKDNRKILLEDAASGCVERIWSPAPECSGLVV